MFQIENAEYVGNFRNRMSSLFDQQVGSVAGLAIDTAGDRHDLTPLLKGELGCDQRAAVARGLDHQDPFAETTDDAVAPGEVPRQRFAARGILRDQRSLFGDLLVKPFILLRIDPVHAAAENGNGPAARDEGAMMRGGIDTASQAADDHQPQ